MRVPDLIRKKQHREVLTPQEIDFFIQGYSSDRIPDYQASACAWLSGSTA